MSIDNCCNIYRHTEKEYSELEKKIKQLSKRSFAWEADSQKEIEEFLKTKGEKLKYHSVNFNIEMNEKRKNKKANNKDAQKQYEYTINLGINCEDSKIEAAIENGCTFILASNDSAISGEEMLKEYKTQSSVEKKFQQLKDNQQQILNYLGLDESIFIGHAL